MDVHALDLLWIAGRRCRESSHHWSGCRSGIVKFHTAVELEEVPAPAQLVAELGVDPLLASTEQRSRPFDHLVDPEVLPTSRRKSRADIGAVQSEVVDHHRGWATPRRAVEAEEGLHERRIRATLAAVISAVLSTRSEVGLGSPIRPVEPPTRQITCARPAGSAAARRLDEVAEVQ